MTGPRIRRVYVKKFSTNGRRELFGEGQFYFDIVRNGYYKKYLRGKFQELTDQDIKNGALYAPVGSGAFEKNTLMTQNTYWQWQK